MRQPSVRMIEGVVAPATTVNFTFEGEAIKAWQGESIASAIMRAGIRTLRRARDHGDERGYFCGMGLCWECAVHVEGQGVVRSCSYAVAEGQVISFADGTPDR